MEDTTLETQDKMTETPEEIADESAAEERTDAEGTIEQEPKEAPEETEEIDYAALAAEDLATLKAQFPALKSLSSLAALTDPVRYAELRELGLSPKEAYLASGGTTRVTSDNRSHLFSAVPRTSAAVAESISASEMAEVRRLFSDLSDAQIYKLHKKVTN